MYMYSNINRPIHISAWTKIKILLWPVQLLPAASKREYGHRIYAHACENSVDNWQNRAIWNNENKKVSKKNALISIYSLKPVGNIDFDFFHIRYKYVYTLSLLYESHICVNNHC